MAEKKHTTYMEKRMKLYATAVSIHPKLDMFFTYSGVKFDLFLPFKRFVRNLWFWPAKFIYVYNKTNVKNWREEGSVKPFCGYVLEKSEGEAINFFWWKNLRKYGGD